MRLRIAISIFCAMACTLSLYALPQFRTERLAQMAKALSLKLSDYLPANMDDDSTWTFRGHRLRIMTNAFGDVSNIGYRMFDTSSEFYHERSFLFNFVERYVLELDLPLNGLDMFSKMDIDHVKSEQSSQEPLMVMLRKVTPETPVSLEEVTLRQFRLKWTIGSKQVSITFPIDNQLIVGADAAELEDIFERDIQRVQPLSRDEVLAFWNDAKIYRSDSMLVAEIGTFLNPMIRGDIYMKEINGTREVIYDAKSPIQSVTNILLTGEAGRKVPLRLTIDRYGYKKTVIDVNLQQLVSLCRMEGCQLYVGIKNRNEKEITATIFALNLQQSYNHVISICFPLEILKGGDSMVSANVYTYVPLHNVGVNFYNRIMNR